MCLPVLGYACEVDRGQRSDCLCSRRPRVPKFPDSLAARMRGRVHSNGGCAARPSIPVNSPPALIAGSGMKLVLTKWAD